MKKFFKYEYVIIEKTSGDGFKFFNVSCNVWDNSHTTTTDKTFKFDYKYEDLKTEEDFNELIEMAENLFNSGAKI